MRRYGLRSNKGAAKIADYFESSALVKLAIGESQSALVSQAWEQAGFVYASCVTYTETRAAIAAAIRAGRVARSESAAVVKLVNSMFGDMVLYPLVEDLAWQAAELAERHALRGYDAIHLATALEVGCDRFVTWDRALSKGALAEGLSVVPQ